MSQASNQLSDRPAPAAPAAAEPLASAPDRGHEERLADEAIAQAFTSLLDSHPEATVAAFEPSGMTVPIPEALARGSNVTLGTGTGPLNLVVQEDRMGLLAAWDRVLALGAASCPIRLVGDAGRKITFCGFDLRATHGVIMAVYVPAGEAREGGPQVEQPAPPAPRLATICKDERSFILKIDEGIERILGWSAEEVVGHRSIEFIHPDDHALAIDNWMEMLTNPGLGRRVRLRHRGADGDWFWFEVTNHNLLEDPQRGCVVCEMVDISEEMAAHEALRAREQLLERLAEALPVGLFQLNSEREIVYTNDRFHEIFGVERGATVDSQLASVIEDDRALLERALASALEQAADVDIEVQLQVGPRRDTRFCSISLRPLSYDDGTISGAIACVADVTDGARLREELKKRATFDPLTGCYNRASIMLALERNIAAATGEHDRALMFIDLDRFKEVNDRGGHAAGDELLKVVAERLKTIVRGDDLVGRIGGDEFLVLCPDIGGAEQALALAERLADAMQTVVALPSGETAPRASVGVAWSRGETPDADTLVARADRAMYEAKRAGGGPVLAAG